MYLAIICIVVLLILLFVIYENYQQENIKVTTYEIGTKNKNYNDLKIVQISDLHSKSFKDNLLVKKIDEIKPDVILCTGDIIDRNSKDFEEEKKFFELIANKYKVYYILGNHELSLKYVNVKDYLIYITKLNVQVLLNEKVSLNGNIDIYAMNYYEPKKENVQILKMNELFKNVDEKKVNIALVHNPYSIELIKKYPLDLVLSGHIHGGLIRIFDKGIFSPIGKMFPKYSGGKYIINGINLIVSKGLGGRVYSNFRINNRVELVVINLRKNVVKKNKK